MDKIELKENEKYLTSKGTPVVYLGITENGQKIRLKSEVTGNEMVVPATYKLKPYDESQVNDDDKALLNNGKANKEKKPKLSAKIDKLLNAIEN